MIAIVIPAHNEERTVGSIVERAKRYGTVIVVNDASTDRTAEIARKAGALVLSHKINSGLGSSIRTGIRKALEVAKGSGDIIITMDADGQHKPEDLPKLIGKINQGYDFALGERDLSVYPIRKRFGNIFLTLATNLLAGTALRDTESGFRAFRRIALERLSLRARRYEIAVEIISEVGRNRIRATNVPIHSPRYVKGVRIIDGIRNFYFLAKKVLFG